MRSSLFALLALLLCALPSQAQAQAQPRFWHSASGADGAYAVEFPGKPAQRKLDVNGAQGKVVTSWLQEVTLDGGATYYGMVWTRIPPPNTPAEAEKMLMQTRDRTAAALKGTVMTTRPVKQGSVTGIDYVIEAGPNATRSRYRSFVVGSVMLQQVYSGVTGSENSANVRKFHESLKLKP